MSAHLKSLALKLILLACTLPLAAPARANEYFNDVVYQVFTDRFHNGRKDNDDPAVSKGLFDSTRTNWKAYWGGDLAGVREKIPYIKSLGCTAIWISPCMDNINKPDNDASGKMVAPYHGYHARDFMKIEEHFGDPDGSWKEFDALTKDAHAAGLKVFVDMSFNHTSPFNHAEYGALYDSGQYKGDVANDRNKYFHHRGPVVDNNNLYQIQYGDIYYLGDLDQENPFVDNYLRQAAARFKSHGADGTRFDAAKHINWGWQHLLTNGLVKQGDHLVLGEWWLTGVDDGLYKDAVKFANRGGIALYDFPFAFAARKAFAQNGDLSLLANVIEKENADFYNSNELLTFIDNHDMPRFLSLNPSNRAQQLALSTLLTSRGIPIVYYGTENGLHNDTAGGEDPYCRPFMESFDENTENFRLIQKLTRLRHGSKALSAGKQTTIFADKNLFVFKRVTPNQTAIIAINKSAEAAPTSTFMSDQAVKELRAAEDALGLLSGVALSPELASLPAQSVSIWLKDTGGQSTVKGAYIYSVRPPSVSAGGELTIYGEFDGQSQVQIGNETIKPVFVQGTNGASDRLILRAPLLQLGELPLTVDNNDNSKNSNKLKINVFENNLVLVTLSTKNIKAVAGEKVYLRGTASALGCTGIDGAPDSKLAGEQMIEKMAGPMVLKQDEGETEHFLALPLPAGKTVELKMVIQDKSGVIRQETKSHKVHVPEGAPSRINIDWQD